MTSPAADSATSPAADSARTAAPVPAEPSGSSTAVPGPVVRVEPAPEPLLPEQSREDTDAAWGDHPESARDRLYRDRPPHWDDF
jgi:hypothetical protein